MSELLQRWRDRASTTADPRVRRAYMTCVEDLGSALARSELRERVPAAASSKSEDLADTAHAGGRPYGARIVIVEDDPITRKVYAAALRRAGYDVYAVPDVDDGTLITIDVPLDAAIVDLRLPSGTGFEILHALRSNARVGTVPVIAISSDERGLALARENPDFFAVLAKPVQHGELLRVVGDAVARNGGQR